MCVCFGGRGTATNSDSLWMCQVDLVSLFPYDIYGFLTSPSHILVPLPDCFHFKESLKTFGKTWLLWLHGVGREGSSDPYGTSWASQVRVVQWLDCPLSGKGSCWHAYPICSAFFLRECQCAGTQHCTYCLSHACSILKPLSCSFSSCPRFLLHGFSSLLSCHVTLPGTSGLC